jgi:hypothetical protein
MSTCAQERSVGHQYSAVILWAGPSLPRESRGRTDKSSLYWVSGIMPRRILV